MQEHEDNDDYDDKHNAAASADDDRDYDDKENVELRDDGAAENARG